MFCTNFILRLFFNTKVISPINNGWQLSGGQYVTTWFEGDMTPNTLDEMIIPNEQNESSDEEDDDGSDNESCISSDEDK